MESVYKIGVSIALSNGVSSVLSIIQKDVLGLNKAVDLTNKGLSRMKIAVGGIAAITVGGGMLAGLLKLEKAGEKYIAQVEQMKVAGLSLAEQQETMRTANVVSSRIMSTTPAENIKSVLELRAALNSAGASPQLATEEANKYLEVVQRANVIMQATAGGRKMSEHGGVYEMVKALEEIRATQNPEHFQKLLEGMARASEAFGGKITAKDWFATIRYTRGAGQHYSDEFLMYYLPTLMQEMKVGGGSGAGGGPGNPLASLYSEVVGNRFSRNARELGLKLHLIDPTKSTVDKHGRIHNSPGAWFDADEAAKNPFFYVRDHLMPKLAKQMGGHMMDVDKDGKYIHVKEVSSTLATLFGNRTAEQLVNLLMAVKKMEGDRKLIETAMKAGEAYSELSEHNPETVWAEFHAQMERIRDDIGKAITPTAMDMLYRLTSGLMQFAEVLERHPVAVKWIVSLVAGLSVLLITLGTIAVAGAALSALGGMAIAGPIAVLVASLMALGGAVLWFATTANSWEKAKHILAHGWDVILDALPRGWARFTALMDKGQENLLKSVNAGLTSWGKVIGHGWDVILDALPRGWARFVALMNKGQDNLLASISAVIPAVTDGVRRMFALVVDAVLEGVGKVSSALMQVADAILNWAKSLPSRIGQAALDAVGIKPAAPGTENHPNGVPTPGPVFGPQRLGDPAHAPGKLGYLAPSGSGNVIHLANYTVVDGQIVAKSVTKHIARAGTGPSRGTTGPDIRAGLFGGNQAAWA